MPTFFVEPNSITPPNIRVSGPLLHHLRESLRLHPDEILTVTDGRGIRYRTEVTEVTAKQLIGRILDQTTAPPKTSPSIVLAQALLKGEKMDWVIQKATELGVDRIVPIHAVHSVVKPRTDRVDHQRARWQRIALEAAQQSERWTLPAIDEPASLAQLFKTHAAATAFMLAERSDGASLQNIPLPSDPHRTVLLLIGPEGGWAQDELHLAQQQGYTAVTLGTRILRAETAAMAAISIVQARLGELG